jgi:cytochrome bd-type quinol oxidase subunit 1
MALLDNISSADSVINTINYVFKLTDIGFGPVLGIMILIVINSVLFLMMKSYTQDRAFAVSLVITCILGIFIRLLGWINDGTLYICIILLVAGIYMLVKESSQGEV